MHIIPTTLKTAQEFVKVHHRHNAAPVGHKFSIGLVDEQENLIGVCIVGRPVARMLDNGLTAEILRVCVLDGYRNANSMLYGAAVRACKAMGYTKVLTYTLTTESGASLRGAGFLLDGKTGARKSWDTPGRKRHTAIYPQGEKYRWIYKTRLQKTEEVIL